LINLQEKKPNIIGFSPRFLRLCRGVCLGERTCLGERRRRPGWASGGSRLAGVPAEGRSGGSGRRPVRRWHPARGGRVRAPRRWQGACPGAPAPASAAAAVAAAGSPLRGSIRSASHGSRTRSDRLAQVSQWDRARPERHAALLLSAERAAATHSLTRIQTDFYNSQQSSTRSDRQAAWTPSRWPPVRLPSRSTTTPWTRASSTMTGMCNFFTATLLISSFWRLKTSNLTVIIMIICVEILRKMLSFLYKHATWFFSLKLSLLKFCCHLNAISFTQNLLLMPNVCRK
jgi:hypothetical protein